MRQPLGKRSGAGRKLFGAAGCWSGVKTVTELLQGGAPPSWKLRSTGQTPLHQAAQFSSPECVDLLLRAGANVHAADDEASPPAAL